MTAPTADLLHPERLRDRLSLPPIGTRPVMDIAFPDTTEPRFDRHAAVLVALVTGATPGVLLTRRSARLRLHAGQVAFPGGRIDPEDATPEAAALREAQEEIGLDPLNVQVLGRLPVLVTGTAYHVTPVVGLVPPGLAYTPAPDEVDCVFVLPLHVVCDPAAPARKRGEFHGRQVDFWVWPHADEYIWGATASILVELAAALTRC